MGGLIVLFLIAGYFIPSIVALGRHHQNVAGIIALNIFLGWTILGWVAAFVWALTATTPAVLVTASQTALPPANKICPKCAEEVKGAASMCRFCSHEFG